MKKSGFLSFIFGMIPGAGQMYLGYMKRGVSLMTVFFGLFAISALMQMGALAVFLPVVWFYAFFDTLNLHAQPYGSAYPDRDDFLFHWDCLFKVNWDQFMRRRHLIGGLLLILLGCYLILQNIVGPIFEFLFGIHIYQFLNMIPSALVAIAIVILGLRLLSGDPSANYLDDDLQEFNQKSPTDFDRKDD